MNELHLFAGAGGGILAGLLLGHRTVCAVEWEPYAQAVLVARQNDGTFPPFPIWDDVQTFDGRAWRGIVDIVAGGFPCQDISVAGKGAGLDGKRSGMWTHMARIIGEVQPRYTLIENSPALIIRGLDRVLADLTALGFDARWGVLGASDVGAPHKRERVWILGHSRSFGRVAGRDDYRQHDGTIVGADGKHANEVANSNSQRSYRAGLCSTGRIEFENGCCDVANTDTLRELQPQRLECEQWRWACNCGNPAHLSDGDGDGLQGLESEPQSSENGRSVGLHDRARGIQPWPADPAEAPKSGLGRVVDGMANRSNRIKAIGNGQVPRVAAAAWRLLTPNAK